MNQNDTKTQSGNKCPSTYVLVIGFCLLLSATMGIRNSIVSSQKATIANYKTTIAELSDQHKKDHAMLVNLGSDLKKSQETTFKLKEEIANNSKELKLLKSKIAENFNKINVISASINSTNTKLDGIITERHTVKTDVQPKVLNTQNNILIKQVTNRIDNVLSELN